MAGAPKTAPVLGPCFCLFAICQASAVWRWSNFLHKQTAPNKIPLRINMDETSVRLFPVMRAGNVTHAARMQKRSPKSLTANVTRGQMRGSMSLVCFVCDDPAIQKSLPQILLVKKQFAPRYSLASIAELVQAPLTVWVVDNSWMTTEMMKRVLDHLRTSLNAWKDTHQIILSADAFRAHISAPVWQRAAALDIMFLIIPAKMTWALQPCDTHVFAQLKHYIAAEVQTELVKTVDGKPTILLLISAVSRAVRQVVTLGNWRMSFWDLGLTGLQACLSETCLQKLEMAGRPRIPSSLPTLAELLEVFPGRSNLPIDDMFRIFRNRGRSGAVQPLPARAVLQLPPHNAAQPWLGRLRSSSALASQDREPHTLSEPCPPPQPAPPPAPPLLSPPPQNMGLPRARRLLPWTSRLRPPPPPAPM